MLDRTSLTPYLLIIIPDTVPRRIVQQAGTTKALYSTVEPYFSNAFTCSQLRDLYTGQEASNDEWGS
jgi:hypothetical protein